MLSELHQQAAKLGCQCQECPLRDAGSPPVLATSLKRRKKYKLAIVGEGPGPQEVEKGRFFAGASGEYIERTCNKYGVVRESIHHTNATLCRPGKAFTPKEWTKILNCCKPRLLKELKRVGAPQLLAFGKRALQCTTGKSEISDWMGANLETLPEFEGRKVVATFHPAHVMRPDGRQYSPMVQIHIGRAWAFAEKKLKPWKWCKIITEPDLEAGKALESILKSKEPVGLDIEDVDGLMMAVGVANRKVAVSLPFHGYYAKGREWVRPLTEWKWGKRCLSLFKRIVESNIPKVYQNGIYDIGGFRKLGWNPRNWAFDTLYAHAVVAPAMRHKLSMIACIEFHADRWKDEFAAGTDSKGAEAFRNRRSIELRIYNAKDAYMTVLLYYALKKRIDDFHNGEALLDGYMRRGEIALRMKEVGIKVDRSKFRKHRKVLRRRMYTAHVDLMTVASKFGWNPPFRLRKRGEDLRRYRSRLQQYKAATTNIFNPRAKSSTDKLFFHHLGVQIRSYTKSGKPQLNQKYLTELVTHPNVVVQHAARALLRYRRFQKLLRTYIDGLPLTDEDTVHPTPNVHGAKTFRFSYQDPNMQNIPKPKMKGKKVVAPGLRDIFVAHDKGWIVAGDYSQIELRVLATLAEDKKLIEWYAAGIDVHAKNAQELFGLTQTPSKQQRDLAKRFVYGLNYGGSAGTVWSSLVVDFPHLTLMQIERLMERWYALHPAIRRWQNNQLAFVRKNRYSVAPLTDHRVYFIGRPEATKVYNYPIQHTAADIINVALEKVDARIDWETTFLLLQVHDELVLSCGPREADVIEAFNTLHEEMRAVLKINGVEMPCPIDVKIGKDYGSCREVSNVKELRKAMRAIRKSGSLAA